MEPAAPTKTRFKIDLPPSNDTKYYRFGVYQYKASFYGTGWVYLQGFYYIEHAREYYG